MEQTCDRCVKCNVCHLRMKFQEVLYYSGYIPKDKRQAIFDALQSNCEEFMGYESNR